MRNNYFTLQKLGLCHSDHGLFQIFSVLLKKIKVSKFNKDLSKTNKTAYIDYFGHSITSELRKLRM